MLHITSSCGLRIEGYIVPCHDGFPRGRGDTAVSIETYYEDLFYVQACEPGAQITAGERSIYVLDEFFFEAGILSRTGAGRELSTPGAGYKGGRFIGFIVMPHPRNGMACLPDLLYPLAYRGKCGFMTGHRSLTFSRKFILDVDDDKC